MKLFALLSTLRYITSEAPVDHEDKVDYGSIDPMLEGLEEVLLESGWDISCVSDEQLID